MTSKDNAIIIIEKWKWHQMTFVSQVDTIFVRRKIFKDKNVEGQQQMAIPNQYIFLYWFKKLKRIRCTKYFVYD